MSVYIKEELGVKCPGLVVMYDDDNDGVDEPDNDPAEASDIRWVLWAL